MEKIIFRAVKYAFMKIKALIRNLQRKTTITLKLLSFLSLDCSPLTEGFDSLLHGFSLLVLHWRMTQGLPLER